MTIPPIAYKIFEFVKLHRKPILIGGGGLFAIGTTISLVNRVRLSSTGEKIVEKIKSIIGTPYIWGSRDPSKGVDCSGTVVWALRELGLEPKKWNATAADMHSQSDFVVVPQPGDLAFYGSLLGGINHVMVYMGDGKVIGSSGGGPLTKTVADAKARNACVKELPVNYRDDFRGYGRLPVKPISDVSVGSLNMLGSC